jgi:signal transduction histidine kinase
MQKVKMGFGLFNLREKLEFWSGSLDIKKISPKGTLATIYFPVNNKEKQI